MSTKWALLKTIQREPDNKLACFAMADMLEEGGWLDLAFCYRWMGWYDRRPGKREGKGLRKRFVWYKDQTFEEAFGDEAARSNALPMARLQPLVFQAMETANPQYQLYKTWHQAIADLAKGLGCMRALLQPPPERKDG